MYIYRGYKNQEKEGVNERLETETNLNEQFVLGDKIAISPNR